MKTMQDRLTELFRARIEPPAPRTVEAPPCGLAVSVAYGGAANRGHWYVTRETDLATLLAVRFDFQPDHATFDLTGPALDDADRDTLREAPLPAGWVRPNGRQGRTGSVRVPYDDAARFARLLDATDVLLVPYRLEEK
jgi:hypothetical protein